MKYESIPELEQALLETPADPEHAVQRVDLLLKFAIAGRETEQWDRMLEAITEAEELATRAGYTHGLALSLVLRGFIEYIHSDYTSALRRCMQALELAGDNEETAGRARGIIAMINWSLGNFDEAIRHGSYAIEVFRRVGDQISEAFGYTTRGGILHSVGRFDEAVEAHKKALELFRAIGNRVGESRSLAGISVTYQALGKYDEAFTAVEESLRLAQQSGHALGISRALNDLGEVHSSRGEYDRALACHEEALALRSRERYRQAEATSLLNIGRVYCGQGDHTEALDALTKGLAIVEEIGALPKARDFHQALTTVYESAGRFEEALRHAKEYNKVKSRISAEQETARQRAIELESQLVWAQKDAEIQRLRNVELKNALDELQAAQAELVNSTVLAGLGSLVAAVAHEINTPLGVIRSAADVTHRCASRLDRDGVAEVLKRNSIVMAEAGDRIATVIRRLKSFAGIDRAEYSRVSLAELMIDTLALLEPEYRGRVEVRREFAEAPDIYCYASELGQVFMNLLRNSVQAIDGAGDINIRMLTHDEMIVIEIADTGRGIPPDQLARLFEAGFNNREKRVKASLSLFAAASIVRRHGGTLDAVSRVGEGSTFTLTLPRSLERAESGLVGASAKAG